jgi:TPR repeat protein
VAYIYDDGKLIEQDFTKAKNLYKKLCDEIKHKSACNNLGYMYENARGMKKNIEKAKYYYGKACDYGNERGCNNYADLNK